MKFAIFVLCACVVTAMAGKYDNAVKAFEKQPEYVRPVATLLGTFGTSGWTHRSAIGKSPAGSVDLPITIAVLSDNDRSYSGVFVDSVLLMSNAPESEKLARGRVNYVAPTIFGRERAPTLYRSVRDTGNNIIDSIAVLYSDGIADVASVNWMPLPVVQGEFSIYHTAIKARMLMRPHHSLAIYYPGWAIQHDLHSLFPLMALNVTLFADFSRPMLNWTPGEGIEGRVTMRGMTSFVGMTIGRQLARKKLDCAMEVGWEHSSLKTGGALKIGSGATAENVTPDMKLDGRGVLRAAMVVGFNPGRRYRITGAATAGAEPSFVLNPLSMRFGEESKREKNKQ